jgi:hypothetical protein
MTYQTLVKSMPLTVVHTELQIPLTRVMGSICESALFHRGFHSALETTGESNFRRTFYSGRSLHSISDETSELTDDVLQHSAAVIQE